MRSSGTPHTWQVIIVSSQLYICSTKYQTTSFWSRQSISCLFLTRLDLLHSTKQQHKEITQTGFYQLEKMRVLITLIHCASLQRLSSLSAFCLTDDTKLWHFDTASWVNFIITRAILTICLLTKYQGQCWVNLTLCRQNPIGLKSVGQMSVGQMVFDQMKSNLMSYWMFSIFQRICLDIDGQWGVLWNSYFVRLVMSGEPRHSA
jgi:hypothetical protein